MTPRPEDTRQFDPAWWMEMAACRGADPDLFHPQRGEDVEPAKAFCRECPVRADCLRHALVNCERYGVWGGTSERDRRRMRREMRQELGLSYNYPLRSVM